MKEIPLNHGVVAVVDDEDYPLLSQYKWFAHKRDKTYYALRGITGHKLVYMHREILGVPIGLQTDHIDGNGLNNQKSNLRIVTVRENQQNQINRIEKKSSRFPGVCWHGASQKWMTRIQICGVRKHIGIFESELEAYSEYQKACDMVVKEG